VLRINPLPQPLQQRRPACCADASQHRLDTDFPSRYQTKGLIKDPIQGFISAKLKNREE
jgi:hypothetical protein